MAENTVIVELAGLPACGKTTLANKLKDKLENKNVAVWLDLTQEFKSASLIKKLGSLSMLNAFKYIHLISTLPKEVGNRQYMLFYAIKISLLYRYAKKYSNYDYVFIDHGFIQQAVSMQRGAPLSENKRFQKIFLGLLETETKYDYLFECQINCDTAQRRMILRNRFAEGRLDAVTDPQKQRILFQKEKNNFDVIMELVDGQELPAKKAIFDMEQMEDNLVDTAIACLRGE